MEEQVQDRGTKIYHQDQSKQVRVGDMEIIGSWGAQAMIGNRNVRAIQIAGDSVSGDVYQVIVRTTRESFAQIRSVALQQELSEEQKRTLAQALEDIDKEIAKGEKANESWLNYLLTAISQISPKTLAMLTDWILEHDDIPKNIRLLARNARPREGR